MIKFDELCERADDVVNGHKLNLLVLSDGKVGKARQAVGDHSDNPVFSSVI